MTRTLILMRHAKSSWDDYTLTDHDRPLNKRGQRSAKALGAWLASKPWQPDQALVSTATRTRETFVGLGLSLDGEFTRSLYHADAAEMQLVLETAVGETVLMIGHNPGISLFAQDMVKTAPKHPRFADFPTGATAVIEFDIQSWGAVDTHTGRVLDFVIPRELLA